MGRFLGACRSSKATIAMPMAHHNEPSACSPQDRHALPLVMASILSDGIGETKGIIDAFDLHYRTRNAIIQVIGRPAARCGRVEAAQVPIA